MKINDDIKREGMCYVLLKTNAIHPIAHIRHELLWYPETGMSLSKRIMYRPYVQSIVTECPWLISCYSQNEVMMWDVELNRWRTPNAQTYGADIDWIMNSLMGISHTIPSTPLDGGRRMRDLIKKLEKSYNKAEKKYIKEMMK